MAQTELYTHYGKKTFWVIPKRRVIIGLAPYDQQEYQQAVRVAEDFRKMGIEIIFINESLDFQVPEVGAVCLFAGLVVMTLAIAFYVASVH